MDMPNNDWLHINVNQSSSDLTPPFSDIFDSFVVVKLSNYTLNYTTIGCAVTNGRSIVWQTAQIDLRAGGSCTVQHKTSAAVLSISYRVRVSYCAFVKSLYHIILIILCTHGVCLYNIKDVNFIVTILPSGLSTTSSNYGTYYFRSSIYVFTGYLEVFGITSFHKYWVATQIKHHRAKRNGRSALRLWHGISLMISRNSKLYILYYLLNMMWTCKSALNNLVTKDVDLTVQSIQRVETLWIRNEFGYEWIYYFVDGILQTFTLLMISSYKSGF